MIKRLKCEHSFVGHEGCVSLSSTLGFFRMRPGGWGVLIQMTGSHQGWINTGSNEHSVELILR